MFGKNPDDSPLNDNVFSNYITGGEPGLLAQIIPDNVKHLFFRNGQAIFGLKPGVSFIMALTLAMLTFFACQLYKPAADLVDAIPKFEFVRKNVMPTDSGPGGVSQANLGTNLSRFIAYRKIAVTTDTITVYGQIYPEFKRWLADTLSREVGFDSLTYAFYPADIDSATPVLNDTLYLVLATPPLPLGYDLSLTQTIDKKTAYPGDQINYSITLTNAGPAVARNFVLWVGLPKEITPISFDQPPGAGSGAETLRWEIDSLAFDSTININFLAQVGETAAGQLVTTSRLAAFNDNNASNDTDTDILLVAAPPPTANYDLTISQRVFRDKDIFAVAEVDSYKVEFTVINNGPGTAEKFTVTTALPEGMTFLDSSAPPASISGSNIYWEFLSLQKGLSVDMTFSVKVSAEKPGTLITLSGIRSGDLDATNNMAADTLVITGPIAGTLIADKDSVSGTWTKAGSPYLVQGEASVPKGKTLRIEPGVVVKFKTGTNGDYSNSNFDLGFLRVNGKLVAEGMENERIVFTRDGDSGNWGIIFFSTENKESILIYCTVEYGDGVRNLVGGDFGNLMGAISFYQSDATIKDNSIVNNKTHGIYCFNNANPYIVNNIITLNSSIGIALRDNSNANIQNNTITNNNNDEIWCNSSNPTIKNTIIGGANIGFYAPESIPSKPKISHSLIQGQSMPGKVEDLGNNIFGQDPQFVDPENGDYRLKPTSPAIGAGENGVDIGAIPYDGPTTLITSEKPSETAEDSIQSVPVAEFPSAQVLIKFKSSVSIGAITSTLANAGLNIIKRYPEIGVNLCRAVGTQSTLRIIQEAMADPNVEYVEPNYTYRALDDGGTRIPNDPRFGQMYNLRKIRAPEAWAIQTGNKTVIVGVLETGIDLNHEDLTGNIWKNPGESGGGKETNGVDDDGNGFVDDYQGWDFANSDNNPSDDNDHGTHVAGVIGASGNNGIGITGVNWTVSLLPVKVLDVNGQCTSSEAIGAILYATRMGAKILNIGWGGSGRSAALEAAIQYAGENDVLVMAAAGNDAKDNDASPTYPASFDLDNIISVAATDQKDDLSGFSNWGAFSVDLTAPGTNIISSTTRNQYSSFSGTSTAAAHVSGAAALVWANDPDLTSDQIKFRLLNSVDRIESAGKVLTGGRLNIYGALTIREQTSK